MCFQQGADLTTQLLVTDARLIEKRLPLPGIPAKCGVEYVLDLLPPIGADAVAFSHW